MTLARRKIMITATVFKFMTALLVSKPAFEIWEITFASSSSAYSLNRIKLCASQSTKFSMKSNVAIDSMSSMNDIALAGKATRNIGKNKISYRARVISKKILDSPPATNCIDSTTRSKISRVYWLDSDESKKFLLASDFSICFLIGLFNT